MKDRTKRESLLNDDLNIIKKELIRSAIMSFCALFVLLFVSFAWFAANSRVSGGGSNVSGSDSYFELRSSGKAGVHDDIFNKISNIIGWSYSSSDNHTTSSSNTVINWLVNENNHMENYSENDTGWANINKQQREQFAIQPGSKGNMKFSVVSKINGNLNLTLNIDLVPYGLGNNEQIVDISDDEVKNLLKGHILFFLVARGENGQIIKYRWFENGQIILRLDNVTKEQIIDYEVYWCWPQSFAEYLLNNGDSYLSENYVLKDVYSKNPSLKNKVISSIISHPEFYLFNSDSDTVYESSAVLIQKIIDAIEKNNDKFLLEKNNTAEIQNLLNLNSAYNQADQSIGRNISFLRVCLSAKMN